MRLAIIGGTGLEHLAQGDRSAHAGSREFHVFSSERKGHHLLFVPRHGDRHQNLPTDVPFKDILAELRRRKADAILAFSSTGSLDPSTPLAAKGCFVVASDYLRLPGFVPVSYSLPERPHAPMNPAFDPALSAAVLAAGRAAGFEMREGIYAQFPGNAFETRAEIAFLRTVALMAERERIPHLSPRNLQVGMTAIPEAILAKELGIPYALVCLPANYAQGLAPEGVTMEDVQAAMAAAASNVPKLLDALLERLDR